MGENPKLGAPVQGEIYADPNSAERHLDFDAASTLQAGQNHYRAYVGPPARFDFMGATQFALLFHLGLREHHRVLDFGCGSLRLGRMLIPFLQKGGYHGIDPNAWLIEDGAKHELGQEALSIKQPKFSYNDDFNCNVFNQTFQFNIAQSLATHMGPDLLKRYLSSAYDCLEPDGIILFSYKRTEDANTPLPANGWHYPDNVSYTVDYIKNAAESVRLVGKAIPWYHPGAAWFVAARHEGALPDDQYLHHLSGAVFREPQFQNSLTPLDPTL